MPHQTSQEKFSKERSVVSYAEKGRDGKVSEMPVAPRKLEVGWMRSKRSRDHSIVLGASSPQLQETLAAR